MKEHLSPEEKLLGLIKGRPSGPKILPQISTVSVETKGQQRKPGAVKVN